MKEKTIFEKINLPSQNLRYLGSGKSVFRLIAKGHDTYCNCIPRYIIDFCVIEVILLTSICTD